MFDLMEPMKKAVFVTLLLFLSSSVVFAAAEIFALTDFIDVLPGSWYEQAVAELQQKSIVSGYGDKTFRPSNNINRAEVAVMLSKALSFIAHPAGADAWQRYINDEFLFVIDYPKTWAQVQIAPHAVGFRPPWMAENSVQWAVIVRDNELNTMEELITEMGTGFPETRSETRQQIELNGKDAWHVVVTTSERPTWRYEQLFIPHFNLLYVITNGAIENSDFDLFWRSLKFLESTTEDSEGENADEPNTT